jgi:multidrug efflux system membrane fusion protein
MNLPPDPSLPPADSSPGPRPPSPRSPPARPGRRLLIWIVLAAIVAALALVYYHRKKSAAEEGAGASAANGTGASTQGAGRPGNRGAGRGGPGGPGSNRPTPVAAVPAASGDIDIYLAGLGTATPLNTVTVKSRVQGLLVSVLFEEGQEVKKGQVLAQIDPEPFRVQLAQAEGQYARDRAQLENAKVDLERYRGLVAQDSAPKQQLDTQAALVRQYEAALKIDQSQIDNARLQLGYARVVAPMAGRVGLRQVDPGNMVTGSEANGLVVITQVKPISVLFTLPQDSLQAVMQRVNAGAQLPVQAWDRGQANKLADGVLASIDNVIDTATGTVKLKARFDNEKAGLFPNQFVNVRMKLDTLRNAIVIPAAALQRGSQGMFVYVVKPDNTVTVRAVTPGPADGQRQSIAQGLAVGEQVVVDGVDRLREGAKVEVIQRREVQTTPDGKPAVPRGERRRGQRQRAGTEAGARPTP